ncbi:MAG: HNH nuclease family protein [Syntrophaceae bacterium]|nr:HNH nuclease family protein [Syntrophaceae bacterium]
MARLTFSSKWGSVKVRKNTSTPVAASGKSTEELVREIKNSQKSPVGESYREKSLSMHGLICARCGREFPPSERHLLTVHHKDGNHNNNPADGNNWENLCVYCHEDVHSREVLAEYLGEGGQGKEVSLVYNDSQRTVGSGLMAEKLKMALQKNKEEK